MSDSDEVDVDTQNYMYSLVHHDTTDSLSLNPQILNLTSADDVPEPTYIFTEEKKIVEEPLTVIPNQIVVNTIDEIKPIINSRKRKKNNLLHKCYPKEDIANTLKNAKNKVLAKLSRMSAKVAKVSDDVEPESPVGVVSTAYTCTEQIISESDTGSSVLSLYDLPTTLPRSASSISLGVRSETQGASMLVKSHLRFFDNWVCQMRDDPGLWKLDEDDKHYSINTSHSSRYFDAEQQAECGKCLKRGHFTESCKRLGPVCLLCGLEGHCRDKCPQRICTACFQGDHLISECQQFNEISNRSCSRCHRTGHLVSMCPDLWRQFHSSVSSGIPKRLKRRRNVVPVMDFSTLELPSFDSSAFTGSLYCCNCALPGHLVQDCKRRRSKFNNCVGSFYSQDVSRYDKKDLYTRSCKLGAKIGKKNRISTSGNNGEKNYMSESTSSSSKSELTVDAHKAEPVCSSVSHTTNSGSSINTAHRTRRDLIEDFVRLDSHSDTAASPLNLREEMIKLAKQLLPEDTSRSQIKKLVKQLYFWRRNGYSPSTPEEEEELARNMEEWVLGLADAHNYLDKLNFKSRWRLLNSTAATLMHIQSRNYSESPPNDSSHSSKPTSVSPKTPKRKIQLQHPLSSTTSGRADKHSTSIPNSKGAKRQKTTTNHSNSTVTQKKCKKKSNKRKLHVSTCQPN